MYTLGIDVGGSTMKFGLLDENGKEHFSAAFPTIFRDFGEDVANYIELFLKDNRLSLDDVSAIGIGIPGTVSREGAVLLAPNIDVKNLPLQSLLTGRLCKPVFILNDADCAVLAETIQGAGKGCESVVLCTFGTGVGMGMVLNGSLYRGFNGCAGELGHTTLLYGGKKCNCGSFGCMEKYCSASALVSQAIQAGLKVLTAKEVFEYAKENKTALLVLDQFTDYVASSLSSVINLLAPEMLLVGGGLSEAGDAFLVPLREKINRQCMASHSGASLTRIEKASLGNRAGWLGAALYAKQKKDA